MEVDALLVYASFNCVYCRAEQNDALAKYGDIWARYEAVYNGMEQVQEVKRKREELQSLEERSE